jgi:hypothetical protein
LEVQAFGRGVGRHENLGLAVAEASLQLVPCDRAPAAVSGRHLAATTREAEHPHANSAEMLAKEVERVGVTA